MFIVTISIAIIVSITRTVGFRKLMLLSFFQTLGLLIIACISFPQMMALEQNYSVFGYWI